MFAFGNCFLFLNLLPVYVYFINLLLCGPLTIVWRSLLSVYFRYQVKENYFRFIGKQKRYYWRDMLRDTGCRVFVSNSFTTIVFFDLVIVTWQEYTTTMQLLDDTFIYFIFVTAATFTHSSLVMQKTFNILMVQLSSKSDKPYFFPFL